MKKPIIFTLMGAIVLTSCGGGLSSLVKWRDDNKNLGIECNISMTEPGMKKENITVGSGSLAHTESVDALNGNWSQSEKALFNKYAQKQCQDIVKVVKKTLNYKNVDIIDVSKVPKSETKSFGRTVTYADYGKTRYDYVWHMNIGASKKAVPEGSCLSIERSCGINIRTNVGANYLVEDWSQKDINKRKFAFQDYMYASCGGLGKIEKEKRVSDLTDSDFNTLSEETIGQCQATSQKKIDKIQQDLEKLNSKKS